MKVIERENRREIVETIKVFQANDGTEFSTVEECKAYEESALGMLFGKLKKFIAAKDVYFEADDGSDNIYDFILPKTQEDLDVMNQIFMLLHKDYADNMPMYDKVNAPYLVGYRFCCGKLGFVWFYDLDKIIRDATGGTFTVELCSQ